jgi:hypothetical protein
MKLKQVRNLISHLEFISLSSLPYNNRAGNRAVDRVQELAPELESEL